jgi:hypothetical protein
LLCSPGWPWIHGGHASVFQGLEFYRHGSPCLAWIWFIFFFFSLCTGAWTQGFFTPARQALYHLEPHFQSILLWLFLEMICPCYLKPWSSWSQPPKWLGMNHQHPPLFFFVNYSQVEN